VNLADIFVIYDIAQFTRGDFINRNRIRTFLPNGSTWLTLPVGKRNFRDVQIREVKIADPRAFREHGRTLRNTYSKALFFDAEICEYVETPHENLAEHNASIITFFARKLDINQPQIILSSELESDVGHGTQGIIDIVKALKGDNYISGVGAREYLDESVFKKESVRLSFLDYKPMRYMQIHPGFVENMSVVDTVFNIGWKETSSRLREVHLEA
jgi:hypothetical protein